MNYFYEAIEVAIQMIISLDPYLIQVVTTSLKVSFTAIIFASVTGILLGAIIGTHQFIGKKLFIKTIYAFMGLPPVFVGLVVYLLLSRRGPIAEYIYLLWTPTAMIIAQVILATPIIAGYTATAIEEKHKEVMLTAKGLGAKTAQAIWMTVREAKVGIIVAIAAAFGRVIAEVGAVTLVGGDIAGQTRVLTTAIIIETRQGNFGVAMAFGLILLLIAFLVNNIVYIIQKR
jgi:tungstate transport system permease protein